MESSAPEAGARAGRPRSERVRLAILEAAADQLVEGGLASASIEAIAARAGVSKVTIYKWWPSRGALAIDAYFHRYSQPLVLDETGEPAHDLAAHIRRLVIAFRGRAGELMAELMGQAQSDPALAEMLRAGWLVPRREATAAGVRAAIERGEVRADIDLDTVMDQLFGPVYYRLSMRHAPLDDDLPDRIVAVVLDGIQPPAVRPSPAKSSLSVMLIVSDAKSAVEWYVGALGAELLWDLGGVAGLHLDHAPFFVHEAVAGRASERSPLDVALTTTRIEVFVNDPGALIGRAAAAGATDVEPLGDHQAPWGTHRQGGFTDPFGHRWSIGDPSPLAPFPR